MTIEEQVLSLKNELWNKIDSIVNDIVLKKVPPSVGIKRIEQLNNKYRKKMNKLLLSYFV